MYKKKEQVHSPVFADWAAGVVQTIDIQTIQRHVNAMVEAVFTTYDHDRDGYICHTEFDEIAQNFPFIDTFTVLDADQWGIEGFANNWVDDLLLRLEMEWSRKLRCAIISSERSIMIWKVNSNMISTKSPTSSRPFASIVPVFSGVWLNKVGNVKVSFRCLSLPRSSQSSRLSSRLWY